VVQSALFRNYVFLMHYLGNAVDIAYWAVPNFLFNYFRKRTLYIWLIWYLRLHIAVSSLSIKLYPANVDFWASS